MYNEGLYFTRRNPSYEQIPKYPLCTVSQTESCQLSSHLTTWNKFLVFLGVRLREVALGRLGFVSIGTGGFGTWSSDISRDPCNILYPTLLLRWLLKEHRCISTLHFKGAVAVTTPQLACDIMHANRGLTSLQLSASCCRWPAKFPMQMVDAIRSLTQLQELELSRMRLCRDSLDLLATILVKMQNLRSFVFYHVKMTPTYRKLLLQAVKNTTITALHVDSDYLCPGIDDLFAEYLAHNVMLKSLTIERGVYYSDDTVDLTALFVALKTNETLTELLISEMNPWNIERDLLVESMTKNSTLETLRFLIPTDEAWKCDGCSAAALATVIRQNGTVRNLDLDFYIPSYDDAKLLLEALACNKSLEQVTFDIQPNMIMDAYRLVRETGTMGRVTFRTDAEKPELFGDALKGCTNSVDITFHLHWTFATGLLHKAFQQFTFCRHLVQLDMSLYKEIDGESAQSFASFLSSTNTLRGLRLGADASVRILGTLLEGLSRNRSISVLLLTRFSFHKSQLHSWERMFQDNTVLRDLTLYLNQQKASLPVVSKFPRFLANNYTLLSASFWDGSWFEPHMYQVQDIVRRNVTMLHRAADFAVGRYTKRCAEAFERMRCHESLVGKVQELDRGTERDAVAKIGVAARYLDVNFMAVAGVVREAVVCDGKAGLQLDGIGLDNWLKVRSYLKVSDIRDRTAWADFQEWLQAR